MTLKSILKKTAGAVTTPVVPEPTTDEQRQECNRAAAIQQAKLIHAQKAAEMDILTSIEHLLDFPSGDGAFADPTRPSDADLANLQARLSIFQPSDFDSLIEERHAADRCGYVLCGQSPRRAPPGTGKFVIQRSRGDCGPAGPAGSKIIDRNLYETWCSDSCVRRAMYIKAQLLEEPAALRGVMQIPPIELLVEDDGQENQPAQVKPDEAQQARQLQQLPASARPAVQAGLDDLADEQSRSNVRDAGGLVSSTIVHRNKVKPPRPPKMTSADGTGLIEGYKPLSRTRWVDSKPEPEPVDWL